MMPAEKEGKSKTVILVLYGIRGDKRYTEKLLLLFEEFPFSIV